MRNLLFSACLAAIIGTTVANAQSPVAYVYVQEGGPGLYMPVYAYAAALDGRLTPIKGSPFAQVENTGMMLATNGTHFIFMGEGPDPGGETPYDYLYSYDVATNGAIGQQVSVINTGLYGNSSCDSLRNAEMDHTGQYIYVDDCDQKIETYKIEKSGDINFQNATTENPATYAEGLPKVAGNDVFAYSLNLAKLPSNYEPASLAPELDLFTRQSDGSLEYRGDATITGPSLPKDYYSFFYYQSFNPFLQSFLWPSAAITNDKTNHFAAALGINEFIPPDTTTNVACALASFTVGTNGDLTSTNTWDDMPKGDCGSEMLLSPNGKVLAVNVNSQTTSLEFLHFNGAAPITKFASIGQPLSFYTMAWDNANHLYALSALDGKLHVYTVNATDVVEAPGSPYDPPYCGLDQNGQNQCPQSLVVRINP